MADTFDVVFHGNSESECIDFISAVRTYAKRQGKIRDNQWIADELYDAFKGKALKWYLRLPEDVQGDWARLQEALLTRWTTTDDDDDDLSARGSSLAILPTPAAAPAASPPDPIPRRTSSLSGRAGNTGRVRLRTNGISGVRFLSKDCTKTPSWSGALAATGDPALALKVRLITTAPDLHRLEMVEHESGLSVLAAYVHAPDTWDDTGCWGFIVGVDAPGQASLEDRRTTYNGTDGSKTGPIWTERWQIENARVLKLCGPGDTTETVRFALNNNVSGGLQDMLWAFRSPLLLPWVEVNLEFEPLDN